MEERRKHPRFKVRVPVLVSLGPERFEGRLKDLCRDAALVEINRSVTVGSELALALQLPGTGGPLLVVGSVVREAEGEDGSRVVAVLWRDVTPATETRIDFFVALQGQDA
jgi:PilZ domain